jgi:hypothetical protein
VKYAYSLDEEDYIGPYDTYEEAYNEGAANIEEDQTSFWIAEVIDTAGRLRDDAEHIADWVLDIVETKMCEFIPADDNILEFTRDQLKRTGNAIIDAVLANCSVVRFGVENEVEVSVSGEDDD